jgi:hypothetical protein
VPQNRAPDWRAAPHWAHATAARRAPHWPQNFPLAEAPQEGQLVTLKI